MVEKRIKHDGANSAGKIVVDLVVTLDESPQSPTRSRKSEQQDPSSVPYEEQADSLVQSRKFED